MSVTFTFTEDFQRALLRLCQLDEAFNHQVQKHVDPGYFTTESLGWTFKMMAAYYEEFGLPCRDMPLRQYVHYVTNDRRELYAREVEAVIALGYTVEADYVRANLREFIQRNLFTQAFVGTQQTYNGGQVEKAFDEMRTAMDSIMLVDFDTPQRSFFFQELSERQKRRFSGDGSGTYTTGVHQLDKIVNGGIHDGEVMSVISYAKIGKTTWLINKGFAGCYMSHAPVLHINLEGKLSEAEDKYEACFMRLLHSDIRVGTIDAQVYQHKVEEYRRMKDLLVIRSLDDLDITIRHIESELSELKSRGFVPKILIVDYADLLRARHAAPTELEHQQSATRDLKRMASNRGLAIWTAFQAQRPKPGVDEKEHILTGANVADCYGKCRIVDGYGSINVTNSERQTDHWRVYWEAYRAAKVGKLFKLKNDLNRMRIGISVEEIKREEVKPNGSPTGTTEV